MSFNPYIQGGSKAGTSTDPVTSIVDDGTTTALSAEPNFTAINENTTVTNWIIDFFQTQDGDGTNKNFGAIGFNILNRSSGTYGKSELHLFTAGSVSGADSAPTAKAVVTARGEWLVGSKDSEFTNPSGLRRSKSVIQHEDSNSNWNTAQPHLSLRNPSSTAGNLAFISCETDDGNGDHKMMGSFGIEFSSKTSGSYGRSQFVVRTCGDPNGISEPYVSFKVNDKGWVAIGNTDGFTALDVKEEKTETSDVNDGYAAAFNSQPNYDANSASTITVTRHNYWNMDTPIVSNSGAGSFLVGDACIVRFNANAGSHAALDIGTTKSSPGSVSAWMKFNINGAVYYCPLYLSKTT